MKNGTNYVKIDRKAVDIWLVESGITKSHVDFKIGRHRGYFASVLLRGSCNPNVWRFFLHAFDLPEGSFVIREEEKKEEPAPACEEMTTGYSTFVHVVGNRLIFSILRDGEELYAAYAYIKGESEVDFTQAISYAAHKCYEFAQKNI